MKAKRAYHFSELIAMFKKGFRPLFAFFAKVAGINTSENLRELRNVDVIESKAYAKHKKLLSRMQ